MQLSGKTVLIVGLGKSGLAAAQLSASKGARVLVTDSNLSQLKPEIATQLDRIQAVRVPETQVQQSSFDLLVLSPGVPMDAPIAIQARAKGIPVTGELELAAPYLKSKKIGITGSNGKTTTTALTNHILTSAGIRSLAGGNIGVAPSAMVADSVTLDWLVLELSSFQLETIQEFRVDISVGLNVTPDHLDRHRTMDAYVAAKRRLVETQEVGNAAVLNADDEYLREFAAVTKATCHWTSLKTAKEPGFWVSDEDIQSSYGRLMSLSEISLPGNHNVENVMAAAAAAHLVGVGLKQISQGVRSFKGVEHRIEFTRQIDGVRYYNDSKATNVDATMKALASFPGRIWLILGGKDKGSDYRLLMPLLKDRVAGVFLIGAAAEKIAQQIGSPNSSFSIADVGTLSEAVGRAHQISRAGDVVLLAPACASFDQFDNFEHRGHVFKQLVAALPEKERQ
jgi:UDP-N-acetylmuramoylalanine--D-glutamate ligase